MTHDRDYYRCLPESELIRLARDSGHELAIALGERLEDFGDIDTELDTAREELREAHHRIRTLESDLEALERDFEALQDARG